MLKKQQSKNFWLALLCIAGIIALFFYVAVNFTIGQTSAYMAHPRAALIEQSALWSTLIRLPLPVLQSPLAIVCLVTAAVTVTMTCYILALWTSRRLAASRVVLSVVLGFATLFFLTSFLALPNLESDLYLYILRSRVFTAHQQNPYTTPAAAIENDPFLRYGDSIWIQYPESKGPTWIALGIVAAGLAGDNMVRQVFAFRTLLLLLNLSSALLIWRILGYLAPYYQLNGIIFYLWNPIVIFRGLQHTEPASIFFLLFGLFLYIQRQKWLGVGSVLISGLTKFTTGPLLLPYLLFLWRGQSLRRVIISGGVLAAGGLVMLLALQDGGTVVRRVLRTLFRPERILFLPGFTFITLWASWRWRSSLSDLVRAWTAILLWFTLFLSPPQYAWYAIPLIGITSLLRRSHPMTILTLAVSLSFLANDMIGKLTRPYWSAPTELYQAIRFGPPILVLLWIILCKTQEHRNSTLQPVNWVTEVLGRVHKRPHHD